VSEETDTGARLMSTPPTPPTELDRRSGHPGVLARMRTPRTEPSPPGHAVPSRRPATRRRVLRSRAGGSGPSTCDTSACGYPTTARRHRQLHPRPGRHRRRSPGRQYQHRGLGRALTDADVNAHTRLPTSNRTRATRRAGPSSGGLLVCGAPLPAATSAELAIALRHLPFHGGRPVHAHSDPKTSAVPAGFAPCSPRPVRRRHLHHGQPRHRHVPGPARWSTADGVDASSQPALAGPPSAGGSRLRLPSPPRPPRPARLHKGRREP
jgi:hypothetical protein